MAEYIVCETDERTYFLKRMLTGMHPAVNTYIFAPNLVLTERETERIGVGEILVCGRTAPDAEKAIRDKRIKVHYMMRDEKFQAANAVLTAEGALGIIIDHTMKSLADINVLVIGFGRTGAAMCKLLTKLDVDYDVATTASHRPAGAFAKRTVGTEGLDLTPYDVIVNTVPEKIISEEQALSMPAHAVYIDLASKPALDLAALQNLGMDADIYPALPAKVSPESAARVMKKYITEVSK